MDNQGHHPHDSNVREQQPNSSSQLMEISPVNKKENNSSSCPNKEHNSSTKPQCSKNVLSALEFIPQMIQDHADLFLKQSGHLERMESHPNDPSKWKIKEGGDFDEQQHFPSMDQAVDLVRKSYSSTMFMKKHLLESVDTTRGKKDSSPNKKAKITAKPKTTKVDDSDKATEKKKKGQINEGDIVSKTSKNNTVNRDDLLSIESSGQNGDDSPTSESSSDGMSSSLFTSQSLHSSLANEEGDNSSLSSSNSIV